MYLQVRLQTEGKDTRRVAGPLLCPELVLA